MAISPEPDFDELTGAFSAEYGVDEITAAKLLELQNPAGKNKQSWMLIDLRTREEQSVSTMPGAHPVRPQDGILNSSAYSGFRDRFGDDALCIVFCTGGKRSAIAAAEVKAKLPGDKIVNLRGGLIAYANLGGKLVKRGTEEPTAELHGYNEKWAAYIKAPARAVLHPPVPKPPAPEPEANKDKSNV